MSCFAPLSISRTNVMLSGAKHLANPVMLSEAKHLANPVMLSEAKHLA